PDSPLSDFFAFAPIPQVAAVTNDQAGVVNGQAVSGGYYAGMRVRLSLGRAITEEDDKPGAQPVVVLSHQFWRERFAGDSSVIGQTLKINKPTFTVIGATPPDFTGTLQVGYPPAVTVPLATEPLLRSGNSRLGVADRPGLWWLDVMGRLKPGATYEQAGESLNGVFQATALGIMPAPRRDNEPGEIGPNDYPRVRAQSG